MFTQKMIKDNKKSLQQKLTKKRIISAVAFFLVLFAFALIFFFVTRPKPSSVKIITKNITADFKNDLAVHFVDVGQGDAIIVELPNGENLLIDAGPSESVDKLISYIDSLNISEFEYVIATHSHLDHVGGFRKIFDKYQVNNVFRPYIECDGLSKKLSVDKSFSQGALLDDSLDNSAYFDFLQAVYNEDSAWEFFTMDSDVTINLNHDDISNLTCKINFLTPISELSKIDYLDANNYSPIILLEYNGVKFMFTGDIESEVEQEYISKYDNSFDVDVLKVAHHGSNTSSSIEFLNCVLAESAIISCGLGNQYGFPSQTVLDNFINAESAGVIYRTDLQGSIVAKVDIEGNIKINTEKTANYIDLITAPNVK